VLKQNCLQYHCFTKAYLVIFETIAILSSPSSGEANSQKEKTSCGLIKVNACVKIHIKEVGMGKIKSIGMAEARPRLTQLVEEVSNGGEPYLIVSGSRVKAVLVGVSQYNDMVERLEDLSDSAELLEAELDHEPTMPFEEHLKSKQQRSSVPTGS